MRRSLPRPIICPTLLIDGNDDVHSPEAARAFHEAVAGSRLIPSPWSTEDWIDHLVGRAPGTVMDLYPRVLPAVFDFLAGVESGRAV